MELLMDAVGQSRYIVVTGTHNDTCVRQYFRVESYKVAPIKRQHGSTSRCRKCYDRYVFDALARLACFARGEDVVAELT
jgi:hypothetical protein